MNEPVSHATTKREHAAIVAEIDRVIQAHEQKNAGAWAAEYAPDVTFFNLAPPLAHRGINTTAMQAWMDTWEGPITLEPDDLQVTVSGDIAYAFGYLRMSGRKMNEGEQSLWMRATFCFRRQNARWKIVHEHTSVPFYMDGSTRAAVDLQPT